MNDKMRSIFEKKEEEVGAKWRMADHDRRAFFRVSHEMESRFNVGCVYHTSSTLDNHFGLHFLVGTARGILVLFLDAGNPRSLCGAIRVVGFL